MLGWFKPKPYRGISIKEAALRIYLEEERMKDPNFSDVQTIFDHNYNPGTLRADGTTEGREGSSFEYLWNFYQGFKGNPSARLTIMAKWERQAIAGGASSQSPQT